MVGQAGREKAENQRIGFLPIPQVLVRQINQRDEKEQEEFPHLLEVFKSRLITVSDR